MADCQPCPQCGEPYARLSRHWTSNPDCSHPEIDDAQRQLLDGLVLAGGHIAGNGHHRHCVIGTTNRWLADWIGADLGWLHHGTRTEDDSGGDRKAVYRVRTHAHPAIDRYERWPQQENGRGRIPPDDFGLSPRAGRFWYAVAGGLEWSGPYDSQRTATFSAFHGDRAAWMMRLLGTVWIESNRVHNRVRLPPSSTAEWLHWIGPPIPGVEHKWAESIIEYRVQRSTPETQGEFETLLARVALQVARERTVQELTPELFDARVDVVAADTVAETIGGGSWSDAHSVSGIDATEDRPSGHHRDPRTPSSEESK